MMGGMILRLLLKLRPHACGPFRRVVTWLWNARRRPVQVRVHGNDMTLNGGNNYPLIVQDHRWFNAPLVELCQQAFLSKGAPITVVDTGAAAGDSVLLIKHRCPGAVGRFVCVEGDLEFHEMLRRNMRRFDDVVVVRAVLAAEEKTIPALVRHHRGTAAAMGTGQVKAVRLDSLQQVAEALPDVLKIDVDGFDGEVLAGATSILVAHRPAVIFEWHPKLVLECGNDPLKAFASLAAAGYTRFLWFTNPGTFSHFTAVPAEALLRQHAGYLLAVNARNDEHFDIIALHESSRLDEMSLACMEHARARADCR